MNENLFQTQYDVTKKTKLKKFYDEKKFLIFSFILVVVIIFASFSYYSENQKKKRILLAENYIKAKIYIINNDQNRAKDILNDIILANDSTYSVLSLFLILNENLISNNKTIVDLFDHVLKNNKFEKEIENLIIYKKILFQSNYINESELLEMTKPLINSETHWKPHALLLIGDYFVHKKEYVKAKEFYTQVLSLKNLHAELYQQASSQLILIENE